MSEWLSCMPKVSVQLQERIAFLERMRREDKSTAYKDLNKTRPQATFRHSRSRPDETLEHTVQAPTSLTGTHRVSHSTISTKSNTFVAKSDNQTQSDAINSTWSRTLARPRRTSGLQIHMEAFPLGNAPQNRDGSASPRGQEPRRGRLHQTRDASSSQILPVIPGNILQKLTLYVPEISTLKKRYPSVKILQVEAQNKLKSFLDENKEAAGFFLPLGSGKQGKPVCCLSAVQRPSERSRTTVIKKRHACSFCQVNHLFCIQLAYNVKRPYIAPLPQELREGKTPKELGYWIAGR